MENTETESATILSQKNGTTSERNSQGSALPESLRSSRCSTGRGRRKSQARSRRGEREQGVKKVGCECEEDDEGKEEVERKIRALQRIVPGGESLGADMLFEQTAGYIVALQCQVKMLRALSSFFEKVEREKTKFGG